MNVEPLTKEEIEILEKSLNGPVADARYFAGIGNCRRLLATIKARDAEIERLEANQIIPRYNLHKKVTDLQSRLDKIAEECKENDIKMQTSEWIEDYKAILKLARGEK